MFPAFTQRTGLLLVGLGLLFVFGSFVPTACSLVGCSVKTGFAFQGISLSRLEVYWYDGCNGCVGSLVPALGGMCFVGSGLIVISRPTN